MRDLLGELSRRNVFKVAVMYVITAWVILQVADVFLGMLPVPRWSMHLVAAVLLLGFPMALVFSWVFEITPQGLKRSEDVEPEVSITTLTGRRLDFVIIGMLAAAVAILLVWERPPPDPGGTPSLAVLPFDDMSEAQDQQYFADGIAEEVLNAVTALPGLQVVGRTSSFRYRGADQDLREIGVALEASHILEGSIRRLGDDVRITAQLIDSERGFHVWSHTYEARLENIFTVQEEISRAIAEALRLELLPETLDQLVRSPTRDSAAYDTYLRARAAFRDARADEDYAAAAGLFEDALRHDPLFAEAEAGLCEALFQRYWGSRNQSFLDPAVGTCDRARMRDPGNVRVLAALGTLYLRTGRPDFARQALEEAIAIAPDDDDVHRGLGDVLAQVGELASAEAHYLKAIELEPEYGRNHSHHGAFLFRNGRFSEAATAFRAAVLFEPERARNYSNLGGLLFYLERYDEAAEVLAKGIELDPTPRAISNAGTTFYSAGDFARAAEMYRIATQIAPDDYRWWGNLADACRHSECAWPASHYYEEALLRVSRQLAVEPEDAVSHGMRAHYLAQLGQAEEALLQLARALDAAQGEVEVAWAEAVTRETLGDRGGAVAALERAVELGYPESSLATDPDLGPVHDAMAQQLTQAR